MACIPSEKSALGEGWGAWGEGNAPCALAKGVSFPQKNRFILTRGPQAVPVRRRRRSLTGIDSRDKGVSFPQKNNLALTGPDSQRKRPGKKPSCRGGKPEHCSGGLPCGAPCSSFFCSAEQRRVVSSVTALCLLRGSCTFPNT